MSTTEGSQPSLVTDLVTMARGAAINFSGMLANGFLGFALVVSVTRGLPHGEAGVFLEAVALFSILSTVVEFGVDDGLVRFVSRAKALGGMSEVRSIFGVALGPVFAAGCAVGIALFVFASPLSRLFIGGSDMDPEAMVPYLHVLAPFVPLSATLSASIAGTRGFGTMLPAATIGNVGRPTLRLLLVGLAIAAGGGKTLIGMSWAVPIVVALGATWAALAGLSRRSSSTAAHVATMQPKVEPEPRTRGALAGEFWRFSAPRGVSASLGITVAWLDTLLVGAIVGARSAAVYNAASRFLVLGFLALGPVQYVMAPLISGLLARKATDPARAVYRAATAWVMVPSWPIYLTMALFAPVLLRVFGPGYSGGQRALVTLALASLASSTTGPCLTVLLMGGRSGWTLAVSTASLATNVVLNLILIPRFGIEGAAIAWAVSIVGTNAAGYVLVRRLMGLSPLGPAVPIVVAASLGCFGVLGLAVRIWAGPTLPALIGFGLVAATTYVAILWRSRDRLHLREVRHALGSRGRAGDPNYSGRA